MILSCLAFFVAVFASPEAGSPPISLDSLLTEMTDRPAIARLPDPAYTCRQSSSYDRKSKDPSDPEGWFANGDYNQFIRIEEKDGRKEFVMHDADGPGAIVHVWSANPKGTMRVYLDGSPTPVIEAPMSDLLQGKWKIEKPMSIETARGCNLYLPIPYSKHCTITSDSDGFYYQVNYRTYPAGTAVESLTPEVLAQAKGRIDEVRRELDARSQIQAAPLFRDIVVAPGERQTADFPAGAGAVSRLFMSLKSANQDQALRSTVIRMMFDGEETVWCPVGDFFGVGPGMREFRTWWTTAGEDGILRMKFPMPYEKHASIAVENFGKEPVTVTAHYAGDKSDWDARSMHFHATWRCEYPIHTRPMRDWNYVTIEGDGVYVGDVLSLMNPVKDWWGEGDEKIYVDGEAFPSHFGTGTEDYYSYAWSNPKTFFGPFNAQPRSDGEALGNCWGRATVTRTRALDAIPFRKSLRMDMEVWHWTECDVEYAATAYFYARPGATTNRTPEPANVARSLVQAPALPPPYKLKDAFECESQKVSAKSDGVEVEAQGGFEENLWSGQQQLWVRGKQIGDFVEMKIPAPDEARRHVIVHATRSWDYAIVRFSVNGLPAGEGVDLFSGDRKVHATGPIDLGQFAPKDGMFVVRAEIIGANEKASNPKTYFGIDCFVLGPADAAK